ncbi:MAG: hypothetical protein A3I33_02450 [Candidatus Colwellbacteria bacterium RIFCSPLOWO2_02_FULL_45_11]|uniref:LamG-like jellyroll fold domain-containing protein n=1 Tax=Candidatus Colwellbacteria bacterium RIFCSPLOWO2_02_FULL_45_11 TaxID=1797692 RepID=A0A1G1Z821_9BACT|nr:MAG: hypothetical protein A3I33_02450 [Candidatus Colwellbacteria bacterium RIFCSPLOWO2_02_FULL_45_11]
MKKKIIFSISLLSAVFLFVGLGPNVYAAAVQGSGAPTQIAVFSSTNSIGGFPSLTFDNLLSVFTVAARSVLQELSFTDATGISLSVSTPIGVGSGGTGVSTFDPGVVIGSGTSPLTTVTPGATGNVLTSDGLAWTSAAPVGPSNLVTSFVFGEAASKGDALYIRGGSPQYSFQVDTGETLINGLQAYYKLEDETEFYVGGGTLDLTNGNSTTFTAGKVNNAGNFVRSSNQSLYVDNNLGINGGAISISTWVKLASLPTDGQRFLIAYQADISSTEYYTLEYLNDAGIKKIRALRQRHGIGGDSAYYTVELSIGTWYNIVLWYDGANIKIFEAATERASTPTSGDGTASLANKFAIGAQWGGESASDFWDGMIDEVGVWSKALATQEMTDLYYGGSGQTLTSSGIVDNVYLTSAAAPASSDAFIGFAAANTTPGSSGSVIINGIVDGLSGLSVGKQYYLSNASGDISIAPGTVTRKVGIATSASTLLITNSW